MYMRICMYMYTYMYTHIHMHIYMYMNIYMCAALIKYKIRVNHESLVDVQVLFDGMFDARVV